MQSYINLFGLICQSFFRKYFSLFSRYKNVLHFYRTFTKINNWVTSLQVNQNIRIRTCSSMAHAHSLSVRCSGDLPGGYWQSSKGRRTLYDLPLSSVYTITYEIVTYVTIVTNFNFFQKIFGIPSLHCLPWLFSPSFWPPAARSVLQIPCIL